MKLYHGTGYNNAIAILNEENFVGGELSTWTNMKQLDNETGVAYFSNDLEYTKEYYCCNEKDCIIVIELDDRYLHSIKEIDPEYYLGSDEDKEKEFFIDVTDLNSNMKILGLYDENGVYQEDWEEWRL